MKKIEIVLKPSMPSTNDKIILLSQPIGDIDDFPVLLEKASKLLQDRNYYVDTNFVVSSRTGDVLTEIGRIHVSIFDEPS